VSPLFSTLFSVRSFSVWILSIRRDGNRIVSNSSGLWRAAASGSVAARPGGRVASEGASGHLAAARPLRTRLCQPGKHSVPFLQTGGPPARARIGSSQTLANFLGQYGPENMGQYGKLCRMQGRAKYTLAFLISSPPLYFTCAFFLFLSLLQSSREQAPRHGTGCDP